MVKKILVLLISACLLTACTVKEEEKELSAESSKDISIEETEDTAPTDMEGVLLGMKSFTPTRGALALKGIAARVDLSMLNTIDTGELARLIDGLFEKGDTPVLFKLDEGFNIEGKNYIEDAYSIVVEDDITVTSADVRGLYYGALTIADYIKYQGGMKKGHYTDWPDTKERTLHLDIARKYWEKDQVIEMIQSAAKARINAVELHFSENEGFRIECETDPAIMSDEYLTKAEVKEILKAARDCFVEIIPSFDSPGHLKQILTAHPEYSLTDVDGYNSPKTLDITNPAAVDYIKSLLAEYAKLFEECRYFNIGGDESFGWSDIKRMQFSAWRVLENYAKATYGEKANGHDAFVGYINDIAAFMRSQGFTVRAWNDGLYRTAGQAAVLKPDPDIEVCYWTTGGVLKADGLEKYIEAGHTVYNVNEPYVYYVLKEDFDQPDPKEIYDQWTSNIFTDESVKGPIEKLGGAYFCIWCDHPDTQSYEEIMEGSHKTLVAFALKAWNSKPDVKYRDFSEQYKVIFK